MGAATRGSGSGLFGQASFISEYATFLQNAGILGRGNPKCTPWAGMRCPFGAKGAPSAMMEAVLGGVQIYSLFHGNYSGGWACRNVRTSAPIKLTGA